MTPGRVVVVAPEYPWPPRSGGTRRLGAALASLSQHLDVGAVLAPRADLEPVVAPPEPLPRGITTIARSTSRIVSASEMLRGLLVGRPLMMGHYYRSAVAATVRDVIEREAPSAVVAFWLGGARLVEGAIDPARVVLDLDNAEQLRFATMAAHGRGVQRALYRADAVLIRRYLARELPKYSAVSLSSADDAEACAALAPSANFIVVENGVDLDRAPRPDPQVATALLLGDLRYVANRDALRWFARRIAPSCPSLTEVRIVGGGEDSEVLSLDKRFVRVGFVADVAAEFDRATVLLAPLRAGAGTRLKILEAMAAGVPVVSTTLGAAGLLAKAGEHLLVADDPASFAAAVERVVIDRELRERLAANGRSLVEARYAWPKVTEPLVRAVTTLQG